MGKPHGQLESRLELVVFLLRLLWACGQRLGVVQAQRHVHSVTGSGLSGGLPGSAQALASKVEPMGIVDEAIEHGVGIGGITEHGKVPLFLTGSCLTSRLPTRIIFCLDSGLPS